MSKETLTRPRITELVNRFRSLRLAEIEEFLVELDQGFDTAEEIQAQIETTKADIADLMDALTSSQFGRHRKIAIDMLNKRNLEVEPSSFAFKLLCKRLIHTEIETQKTALSGMKGDFLPLWGADGAISPPARDGADSIMLAEAIERYCEQKRLGGNWNSKTDQETTRLLAVALRFFGDVPIDSVSKKQATEYLNTLQRLPKDFMQREESCLRTIAALNDKENKPTLNPNTIKKIYFNIY